MADPASPSQVHGLRRQVAPSSLRVEPVGRPLPRRVAPPPVELVELPPLQYGVKRVLDYLLAVVGVVLALPLCIPIAVLIKLDSRGPIFFRQERVGRGGLAFRVIKFRTMYDGVSDHLHREFVRQQLVCGADQGGNGKPVVVAGNGDGNGNGNGNGGGNHTADGSRVYKMVSDHRVTRLGWFLRRTSLDELPQLINVLGGEMSMVGPRPPLPYELEDYEPWQFQRLAVIPGITGLWQVSGRNLLSYRQMCQIDLDYIGRWSLWLDMRILLKTIPVVLFRTSWTA